jgi:hypothetical protein
VTYADVHREICRQWYPRGDFVRIVDSKRREWLVYDASDYCTHRSEFPFGSSRANVRIFWREDHVRAKRFRDEASLDTTPDFVMRQLRYSERIDFPEHATRSTESAIQDLYDSRRGMGRR